MARDLRRYASQTNRRLFVGFLLLLLVVGLGLIGYFYGGGGAILGFACLLLGLAPLIVIWLGLQIMEWLVKRVREEEE